MHHGEQPLDSSTKHVHSGLYSSALVQTSSLLTDKGLPRPFRKPGLSPFLLLCRLLVCCCTRCASASCLSSQTQNWQSSMDGEGQGVFLFGKDEAGNLVGLADKCPSNKTKPPTMMVTLWFSKNSYLDTWCFFWHPHCLKRAPHRYPIVRRVAATRLQPLQPPIEHTAINTLALHNV